MLNGVPLSEYVIVYGKDAPDYNKRAAEYLKDYIKQTTGATLTVRSDSLSASAHELVVGETRRDISVQLDADTDGVQFAYLADEAHVAMEGDFFVIAAAAYYFANTYITGPRCNAVLPAAELICEPITLPAKNYIFLIGDGMGVNQTKLFEVFSPAELTSYSDGESEFYGYMLPAQGLARTDSFSGTTDSAAAGTALATGFKTNNGYIGKDSKGKDVPSLTEIAGGLGMATAVMSTEVQTGATPASFSAHASDRNDVTTIINSQLDLVIDIGTVINCQLDYYDVSGVELLQEEIIATLEELEEDEDGFFIMYEEAHIDKHCHSNDFNKTFLALVRFNQAIGVFMEYAFYHPDTFLLITADHETGNVKPYGNSYAYNSGNHSSQNVPVFAFGELSALFDGQTVENIQIPKTIAADWGVDIAGTLPKSYPALQPKK